MQRVTVLKLLTHLAVWLCVIAQGWVGCAGGGKTLCFCFEGGASDHAVHVCNHTDCPGHDHDSKLPVPIPVHEHDHDCSCDMPLSDCGRVASAGMAMSWKLVCCGELLPYTMGSAADGVSSVLLERCRRTGTLTSAGAVRAASGLCTTRLLI